MDWYYALDGRQAGPVSEPELGQLLRSGTIDAATLVWREGMKDWIPYSAAIGMPAIPRAGVTPAAPGPVAGRLVYAGFWIRWLAYVIDGIVIGAIRQVVLLPLGLNMIERNFWRSPWFYAHIGEAGLTSLALTLAYFVFFWTQYGATPGKMVLKLKVVNPQGGPITLGAAVIRYFGQILSGIIAGIGFLMAAFDDEKRALHDRLAETRVIRIG